MKYTLIILTLFSSNVFASSFFYCHYILDITGVHKKEIAFKVVEYSYKGQDPREKNDDHCKEFVKTGLLPLDKNSTGIQNIFLGHKVKAIRSYYSGMGPDGVVQSVNWRFEKIKAKK